MQRLTTYTLTSLIARQIDVQSTKARVNSEVSLKLGHFVRMCCNWKIFKFNTEFSLCLLTNGENFQSFSSDEFLLLSTCKQLSKKSNPMLPPFKK